MAVDLGCGNPDRVDDVRLVSTLSHHRTLAGSATSTPISLYLGRREIEMGR